MPLMLVWQDLHHLSLSPASSPGFNQCVVIMYTCGAQAKCQYMSILYNDQIKASSYLSPHPTPISLFPSLTSEFRVQEKTTSSVPMFWFLEIKLSDG